jgi:hypothetical protein
MAQGHKTGGRIRGTPNRASVATWERIEKNADPIGFLSSVLNAEPLEASPTKQGEETTAVIPTLDQRLTAASQLSRWMPPPPRIRPLALDLPEMSQPEDMVAVMASVMGSMASGEITPDEAKAVAEVVELQRRAIETQDLEQRITALEKTGR